MNYRLNLVKQKIYKLLDICNLRMFPGDPLGLPDDFFFNSLNGDIKYGRYNCFY